MDETMPKITRREANSEVRAMIADMQRGEESDSAHNEYVKEARQAD